MNTVSGGVNLAMVKKRTAEEEERVIAASGVTMAAHASELEIAKKNLTDAIGDNVKQ